MAAREDPSRRSAPARAFTYEELENHLTGRAPVPPAVAERIEALARASDHKRALPPMPD